MDWNQEINTKNERISLPLLEKSGVELFLKREDLIHPEVSGNKWRKLKYHMLDLLEKPHNQGILTKGGAYSNHILATAAAAHAVNIASKAFIRGECIEPLNPTLKRAQELGMEFHFVTRDAYKLPLKDLASIHFGDQPWVIIPEGGTDAKGIKGCTEILTEEDKTHFDTITVSFGTGGTASGLIQSLGAHQSIRIYPALRGMQVKDTLLGLADEHIGLEKVQIISDYHFGGYAKIDKVLMNFIRDFEQGTGIPLDPVYTSKMIYGLLADIEKGNIPVGSRVLAIHTGGLQGRWGMEQRLGLDFRIKPMNLAGDKSEKPVL